MIVLSLFNIAGSASFRCWVNDRKSVFFQFKVLALCISWEYYISGPDVYRVDNIYYLGFKTVCGELKKNGSSDSDDKRSNLLCTR